MSVSVSVSERPDRRRCTRCGKVKPLDAYPPATKGTLRLHSWCRVCCRVAVGAYQQTGEYRAWLKEYLARPDVKARRAEADSRRAEKKATAGRAYRKTPRARLLHSRVEARRKLRAATTEARKARLRELIASYERELDRIDRAMKKGVSRG